MTKLLSRLYLVAQLFCMEAFICSCGETNENGQGGAMERFESLQKYCPYGDVLVPQGQVVLSLPVCCMQLVCLFGRIVEKYHYQPGDANCCEFAGILYSDGATLPGYCTQLRCRNGQWTTNWILEKCCSRCGLYNDPHIITFDIYRYDWHGTCNYSIAQSDLSYDPRTGVFSDFQPCNRRASCLDTTTFRDNPNTIITLSSRSNNTIIVNGEDFVIPKTGIVPVISSGPTTHPVLVWQSDGCVILFGASKIMLKHCRSSMHVWAYPSHTDSLDGLCGHFNFHPGDEFRDRTGHQHPLSYRPYAFPYSWMSDPCHADQDARDEYAVMCERFLSDAAVGQTEVLAHHIETCIFDVCLMSQEGANLTTVEEWLEELRRILKMIVDVENGSFGSWNIKENGILDSLHGNLTNPSF
nr:mucin-2-like isoform X2 [Penaeus vannamei]